MTHLYRYEARRYSEGLLMLVKYEFRVVKETPCGVQIDVWGRNRFVNLSSKKRYACPTPEEAFVSYQARKNRQIRILRHRLAEAEAALKLVVENELSPIWNG